MRPEIPISCPSSNYTWPAYETLSICSSCAEVSPLIDLTYTCTNNTTIDWSTKWIGPLSEEPYPRGIVCGYFLNVTSPEPILLSGYIADNNTQGEAMLVRTVPLADFNTKEPFYGVGSIAFKNIRNPLMAVLIASATGAGDTASVYGKHAPLVHECMLSWCVQTIYSNYDGGKYSENVTSTLLNVDWEPMPWPWVVKDDEFFYTQNITLTPPPTRQNGAVFNTSYMVDSTTAFTSLTIFDDFFPSFYTAASTSAQPVLRFKNYLAGTSTRFLNFNPWLAPNNVTRHMERLAMAMTNIMRSDTVSQEMLHGRAYSKKIYVSIQWEWLIFLLLLLILSLVFLVSTIIKPLKDTSIELWKTSAMPTLIHSLPKDTPSQLTTSSTWSSTKKIRIRLSSNKG